MKCMVLWIGCLLLLTGCAAHTPWETVRDELPQTEAVWSEPSWGMNYDLPEGMEVVYEAEGETVYVNEENHMELSESLFLADGVECAVKLLSGYESKRLQIIQTKKNSLSEYRFVWHTQTEEGGMLNRAHLIMDGMYCYALVCRAPEETVGHAAAVFSELDFQLEACA